MIELHGFWFSWKETKFDGRKRQSGMWEKAGGIECLIYGLGLFITTSWLSYAMKLNAFFITESIGEEIYDYYWLVDIRKVNIDWTPWDVGRKWTHKFIIPFYCYTILQLRLICFSQLVSWLASITLFQTFKPYSSNQYLIHISRY